MAADSAHRNSMSLVPYQPTESREIVLRHGSAVVVYDPESKQLSLRDASQSGAVELTKCPTCHRPYHEGQAPDDSENEGHDSFHSPDNGFVNPDYFRMLHHSRPPSRASSRTPPARGRAIPGLPQRENDGMHAPEGAEFVQSAPSPEAAAHGISAEAFSQNYFKTFFVEERELGRGGKGVVLLVKHVLDGVSLGHFACKRVPVGDDHEWLKKVLVEVQLLQGLSHQNLVSYRHVWLENYQITPFGPAVPCAFILQQYCNAGDLQNYVLGNSGSSLTKQQLKDQMRRKSRGQLDPVKDLNGPRKMQFEEILSFLKDITSGLNHLHAHGYIHRDLKPSNCLLHNNGRKLRVLVSDFGEVQMVNATRSNTGATGTISYCAPEVLRRQGSSGVFGNFSTKSDIFSLGMIVYFMCFGRLPYHNADGIHEDEEDLDQLRVEISQWPGFDANNRARADLPEKLYRSLKRLLAFDPNERPGTDEILQGIRAGSMVDEPAGYSKSFFDAISPRITRADTPSPQQSSRNRNHNSLRPGLSKLRPSLESPDSASRSPSPASTVRHNRRPSNSSIVLRRGSNKSANPTTSGSSTPGQELSPSRHDSFSAAMSSSASEPSGSPLPHSLSQSRLMLPPGQQTFGGRLVRMLAANTPVFLILIKIALFCGKVLSLYRPCAPFAANPWIAYPLLCLAAIDFASLRAVLGLETIDPIDSTGGVRKSAVLLVLHLLTVLAARKEGRLCLRGVLAGPMSTEVWGAF